MKPRRLRLSGPKGQIVLNAVFSGLKAAAPSADRIGE